MNQHRSGDPTLRLTVILSGILLLTTAWPVEAQTTTTPSAHFGAIIYPQDTPGYELGIHLNRFTEFDKVSTLDVETGQPVRYNDIDETLGFNLAALAVTNHFRDSRNLLYRFVLQAGVTADEPTEYLQNKVIHDLRDIPHVPVGDAPTRFDAAFTAELNRWFGRSEEHQAFAGAGVSLGTINQDAFLQAGLRTAPLRVAGHPIVHMSAVARTGVPAGGLVFNDGVISDLYGMVQGYATSFIAHTLSNGILPAADWGVTYSTGFFIDETGDPISEFFWTIRLWWPNGVAFETWNDSLNQKDRGPTYGLRLTTMLDSIPGLDALFGVERQR